MRQLKQPQRVDIFTCGCIIHPKHFHSHIGADDDPRTQPREGGHSMSTIQREGVVNFGDASLNVIEKGISNARSSGGIKGENDWELQFKREVFLRIVQQLNRLGWTVKMPPIKPSDVKQYGGNVARWSAERHRHCSKGDLKGELEVSGRCIHFKMFQSVNCPTRPDHDGRYESDKEACMPYVLRLEMERTRRRIRDYLCGIFEDYTFDSGDRFKKIGPNTGQITALEHAAIGRRTSGHYVPELDRANFNGKCAISKDGLPIENGTRVYAKNFWGRIVTGTAFYSLNSQWQIVTGKYSIEYVSNDNIWINSPGNLRTRRDTGQRRRRLENEMSKAVAKMDFERAATLRDVLFPKKEPLYMIWHTGHNAYHGPNYSGYYTDTNRAGKFTASEAAKRNNSTDKLVPITEAA